MFGSRSKAFFMVIICVAIVAPMVIMIWKPILGALLFLVGLIIAHNGIMLVRSIQVEATLDDTSKLTARQNRGQTIFVQLVDDQGRPLPASEAQARLAAAQQQAGPRDTVIGVHNKVA